MEKKHFEQYMDSLLSQIREKRARERVRREIEGHLEDQKAAYMSDGMTDQEAVEAAVADMGDPVEAGTALDRIHRPKPAWGMLAVIAGLCACGVLLQYMISMHGQTDAQSELRFFQNQILYAVIGFALLCGVYLLDYTRIAAYSGWACKLVLLILFVMTSENASFFSDFFNLLSISAESILYLYVPLYGAVLYAYRNTKRPFWYVIVLYTMLPLLLAVKIGRFSLLLNLTVIFLIMLGTAAAKGWFGLSKKALRRAAGIVFFGGLLLAVFWLHFIHPYDSYRSARIYVWLHPGAEPLGAGYISSQIHAIVRGSQLVGPNTMQLMDGYLPDMSTSFALTFLIGYCGILAAAALILLFVFFGIRLLRISLHQKNQLGLMMGLGCSLVFSIQSAEYILINLGLLPVSGAYFPLISYGGNGMLYTCILLGILLSIYRYQDVVSEPVV